MPRQFIKKRPLSSFALLTTACLALGVVVTQVQANIPSSAENIANNAHQIPDELNPKLNWKEHRLTTAGKIDQGDLLVKPEDTVENEGDQVDTIHSIAMKDNKSFSKPIYDYTTGTSN
jgi:predicted PurR-regulated permease PerM